MSEFDAPPVSSSELMSVLSVSPAGFRVDVSLHSDTFLDLQLHNDSNSLVSFKIKTTARDRYLLKPTQEYVPAGGSRTCKIVMAALAAYPDPTNPKAVKDKFLIQSVQLPAPVSDLSRYWKERELRHSPKEGRFAYAEQIVKCRLLVPQTPDRTAGSGGTAAAGAAAATPPPALSQQAAGGTDSHGSAGSALSSSQQPLGLSSGDRGGAGRADDSGDGRLDDRKEAGQLAAALGSQAGSASSSSSAQSSAAIPPSVSHSFGSLSATPGVQPATVSGSASAARPNAPETEAAEGRRRRGMEGADSRQEAERERRQKEYSDVSTAGPPDSSDRQQQPQHRHARPHLRLTVSVSLPRVCCVVS